MFLKITTTTAPATDIGYLLHKNPVRRHEKTLPFGKAIMFYPEAEETCCSFVLLLDVDPIGLVRGRPGSRATATLADHYVNDRPYAASSLLSVAIARCLGTALSGRCSKQPELVERPFDFTAEVTPLPCRGGDDFLERIFAPLGYGVEIKSFPLDEKRPEWGESPYVHLTLTRRGPLRELLNHLYVLIPVLDNRKHYYVGEDEIEKLLRKGEGWLAGHPEKEAITRRYLKYRKSLANEALARLAAEEGAQDPETEEEAEEELEKPIRLNEQRLTLVEEAFAAAGAKRVMDLGCGSGKLLYRLFKNKQFEEILGIDVSLRDLEVAERRLRMDRLPTRQQSRIRLLQGALTYRDARLQGYDAAALVEVIEHLDLERLGAMEKAIFAFAAPKTIVVTTPNREFNATFENLPKDKLRHPDHRFEWTRAEFRTWAEGVAERHGYALEIRPVGELHPELGAPTQMGVFSK